MIKWCATAAHPLSPPLSGRCSRPFLTSRLLNYGHTHTHTTTPPPLYSLLPSLPSPYTTVGPNALDQHLQKRLTWHSPTRGPAIWESAIVLLTRVWPFLSVNSLHLSHSNCPLAARGLVRGGTVCNDSAVPLSTRPAY